MREPSWLRNRPLLKRVVKAAGIGGTELQTGATIRNINPVLYNSTGQQISAYGASQERNRVCDRDSAVVGRAGDGKGCVVRRPESQIIGRCGSQRRCGQGFDAGRGKIRIGALVLIVGSPGYPSANTGAVAWRHSITDKEVGVALLPGPSHYPVGGGVGRNPNLVVTPISAGNHLVCVINASIQ